MYSFFTRLNESFCLAAARLWLCANSLLLTMFASKRRLAALVVVLAGPAGIGVWVLALHLTGNIHTVEPSAFYRSAQLTGSDLQTVIGQYGIKTVINLRGQEKGSPWYDEEIAVSERLGVAHVDIHMSARSEPAPTILDKLISTLRDAPRPILVHCKDGADRTGLASALYELLIAGRASDVAHKQLSFRYGHFPWLGSATAAMDRTLAP